MLDVFKNLIVKLRSGNTNRSNIFFNFLSVSAFGYSTYNTVKLNLKLYMPPVPIKFWWLEINNIPGAMG
jgi:hypothetical protein